MSGPSALVAPVVRAELAARVVEVLHRGNRRNPDVLLIETPAGRWVVKDFSPRGRWVRAGIGRWITAREARAYRALEGHPAVPRFAGAIDRLAFAIEYRPGRRLSRRLAGNVPAEFVDRVEDAVREMHRRGVVHLDLRHRSNVLADEAGRPVLIDFGSALCLRPGGWPARLLLPWLARIDLAALRKWRVRLDPRYAPPSTPQADAERDGPRSAGSSRG